MRMFAFVFFYLVGTFVFFCHTAIVTTKSTIILSSRMHLTEDETAQLQINYFAKILFQTVMMIILPISFALYSTINTYWCNTLLVSSGLSTIPWLMITGIIIKFVYYLATHKIQSLKVLDYDKYPIDKEFFWIMCPILYGVLFSFYDHSIFFSVSAIVLGKYIWMDSFRFISLSNIKIGVVDFLSKSKTNILLLFCQTVVMGYILARWYPIKDESIFSMYTINTFVVLALFLMPTLDLFIFESMKSYSGFIIRSRK